MNILIFSCVTFWTHNHSPDHKLLCYTFISLIFVILPVILVRDLLNLLRNVDLIIISFVRPFVIKGLLLCLIFFFRQQMHLVLIKIYQEVLRIASQVVKSCFEVLCRKNFYHTFCSNGSTQLPVCV